MKERPRELIKKRAAGVYMYILTHDVEIKGLALAIALGVVANAGVVPGVLPAHPLQHQALIADYHALRDVVTQCLALRKTNKQQP